MKLIIFRILLHNRHNANISIKYKTAKESTKQFTAKKKETLLYPVLIYTPNKVKPKQREEKKWLRQTEHPIYQSLPMIQPVFSFGCKIFVNASCFKLISVGENSTYFRTFASEENRWTSDGKGSFPVGSDSSEKCGKTDGFWPEKQAKKGFSAV